MAQFSVQRLTCLVTLLGILSISSLAAGDPVIVYDNTQTPTSGDWYAPNGFFRFDFYAPNEPIGDLITLATSSREIVEFDVIVSSSLPTILSSLTLTFYEYNPGTFEPTNQLWTGAIENIAVDGITSVAFEIPSVTVGDSFVWVANASNGEAGLATFDPPTIGSSGLYDFFYDYAVAEDYWYLLSFEGNLPANFGAKVYAVPEPTTLSLLLLGGLVAVQKRRKQRRIKFD